MGREVESGGMEGDAFRITPAAGDAGPFIFASPHSGSVYPADMDRTALPDHSLRSAEDALVDRLAAAGPVHGAALIAGEIGRAYLDLNREPDELDPLLIADAGAIEPSPRAAAGYGVVPRLSGDGRPLYDRWLSMAEVQERIARVHAPYHSALGQLMTAARERTGRAVLVDWHSMPARAGGPGRGVDVVLGDRHGSSCDPAITRRLRALFEGLGWRVALNHPYAGGYSTRLWARPDEGFHAIQIELSRALYFDEAAMAPGPGWSRCEKGLARVIAGLAETAF
ncbi:MAG: N-formylglutamate amidohydrolase [Pseudomonadota bacterium]